MDYLPLVMYSYAANFYKEVCQKSFSKDQQVKDIFDSEEITGFSNLNDKGSSLNTLIHWIKTGFSGKFNLAGDQRKVCF